MELELRRLEDLAESIVNDFAYMRAREEEMRDTNGKCMHVYSVDNWLSIIFPSGDSNTVFTRSDATATIYFIALVCAAFIQEW